jgi:opacity protein-like surface antigen
MNIRERSVSLLTVAAFLASASIANAGAYGDAEQPTELPAPPPAHSPRVDNSPPRVGSIREVKEAEPDFARNGFYAVLGGTYAFESFETPVADDSAGVNVRLGYRLHPHVAVEAEYEWYDDFADSGQPSVDGWWAGVNAKLYTATGWLQPYFLVGAGVLGFDGGEEEVEEYATRIGGGIDFYATENVAVDLEIAYLLPTGDLDDFNVVPVSLNLMYRF